MNPFKRIKNINGQDYVYEITPFYDKELKKIRQKSVYIGKYIGNLDDAKKVREKLPIRVLSYGEFVPLFDIISELNLYRILECQIGEKYTQTMLGLAMSKIVDSVGMYGVESWNEGTILSKEYNKMITKSQSISNFLKHIGREEVIQKVSKEIIKSMSTISTLIYDITSISSYSKLINLFEYGYNRDRNDLPQINYAVVIDKGNNIPVMFDVYSGSVVDVSSLKNTIEKLKSAGVKDFVMVMDRGLFSIGNIEEMDRAGIGFIIPGTLSNKVIKEEIINLSDEIEDVENLKKYNDKPIFTKEVRVKIGEREIKGYLYYEPEKAEKRVFYLKLYEILKQIEAKVLKKKYKSEKGINKVIEEIGGEYKRFYEWNKRERKVDFNTDEVNKQLKVMGRFILLYRGNYSWDECLEIYHSRNIIEEGFDMLKNELQIMPLNVKNEDTLRGLLFVHFISMILRMRLQAKMKKSKLNEKYTFNLMLLELKKLKKIELEGGKIITTITTKKQKEILKHFNYVPK
jgi:transposase